MDQKLIEKLIEAINNVVQAHGPYKEKAAAIRDALSEDDKTNLAEFLSWFDDVSDL